MSTTKPNDVPVKEAYLKYLKWGVVGGEPGTHGGMLTLVVRFVLNVCLKLNYQ